MIKYYTSEVRGSEIVHIPVIDCSGGRRSGDGGEVEVERGCTWRSRSLSIDAKAGKVEGIGSPRESM